MSGTREIRRRIKSVKNTGKITRAMEMISSVKMRKASASVVALRPYAERAISVFSVLSKAKDIRDRSELFLERPAKKVVFLVITSNRGLCGSFNSQLFRKLRSYMGELRSENQEIVFQFVSVGRKGDQMLKTLSGDIIASFSDGAGDVSPSKIRSIATFLFEGFELGTWDHVFVVYTDFASSLIQTPKIRSILPFSKRNAEEGLSEMLPESGNAYSGKISALRLPSQYVVEPSSEVVLRSLLFRLVEVQILHAIFESKASEEAARMVAMRNATDAAGEMTDDLTLMFNQIRQSKVTQEIAELSAGMAAVS